MPSTDLNEYFNFVSDALGIAKKLQGPTFVINLTDPDQMWVIDTKNLKASKEKPAGKVDVELTMKTEDFLSLISGDANPQQLFMGGKIKFKGNMAILLRFQSLQQLQKYKGLLDAKK